MAPSLTGAQTRMARALQAILSSENPMTVQVAITLTDEQKAQLDLIAETRGGAVAEVVQEALQSYLHYDAKFAPLSRKASPPMKRATCTIGQTSRPSCRPVLASLPIEGPRYGPGAGRP
jgi:hypothetical protein